MLDAGSVPVGLAVLGALGADRAGRGTAAVNSRSDEHAAESRTAPATTAILRGTTEQNYHS